VMWTKCRLGHRRHQRIQLGNRHGLYRSLEIPDNTGIFTVYDWPQYLNKSELYCTGQDVISQTIQERGIWEPAETRLFIDVLNQGEPGLVLDVGCQIGWYSTLAAMYRHEVWAVDVNKENLQLAVSNMMSVATAPFQTWLGYVNQDAPLLPPDLRIKVVKVDIEGAEQWAIRMLTAPLSAGQVDYLFMEVSPVFNDTYPRLFELLDGWGYVPFEISAGPNPAWIRRPIVDVDGFFDDLWQTDVLFIRKDLT